MSLFFNNEDYKMFVYSAFELIIGSDLELPEFQHSNASPTVFFRFGKIDPPEVPCDDPVRIFLNRGNGILLYWSAISAFLVESGSKVTITAVDGIDEKAIRLLLTGPVLGVLLYQRGFHVFHASVVYNPQVNGAFAFMAEKGEGKSTTASIMYNHGYYFMSDDILALSYNRGVVHVLPGFPHSKLCDEAATALIDAQVDIKKIGANLSKRGRVMKERFLSEPSMLKALFALEYGDTLEIVPLQGKDALKEVLPQWYGALFTGQLIDLFGRANHFLQCTQLVKVVPIYKIRRPKSLKKLPEMAHMLDEFIVENSKKM